MQHTYEELIEKIKSYNPQADFEMIEKGISHEDIRAEMYKRLSAIQKEQEKKLAGESVKKEGE